jgi:ribosome-associated heat shock protein Hsp15
MAADGSIRIDKWLWYARFFKSRSLAAAAVTQAVMRVNGARVTRAAHPLRPGDALTFAQGGTIRVVRVLALGQRRGPASMAQELYVDLVADTKTGASALE